MDLTRRPGFLKHHAVSDDAYEYEVQAKYKSHTRRGGLYQMDSDVFFSTSNAPDLGVGESREKVDEAVRQAGGDPMTTNAIHNDISRTALGHGIGEMQEGLLQQAGYYNPGARPLKEKHYPKAAQSALIESNEAAAEAIAEDPPIQDMEDYTERDLEIRRRGRRAAEGVRITRPW